MSTLLSEEDLNDYISPALACTKPTVIKKEETNINEKGEYEVGKEEENLEKVTITLSDCLACSGCITSSEEIMLSRQSHTVFLDAMKSLSNEKKLAVSISPQCRVSMATFYEMEIEELDLCLINFFKTYFKARYVVGTQIGRNVTIQRTNEYLEHWKATRDESDTQPRLSASCPGFVIYTEKTKPDLVPLLLNVKSPQQITGNLLKKLETEDEKLYHLTIMPCFDKKLEASRPDSEGEVECVITPKEFVSMLQELNIDFKSYSTNNTKLFKEMSPLHWDPSVHWSSNKGSSSGGFAFQYIYAIQQQNEGSKILTLPGKNSNIIEYRLVDSTGTVKIASASELSGFRNIQNMVRTLTKKSLAHSNKRKIQVLRKRNNTPKNNDATAETAATVAAEPYKTDFIEVNASPGGCINGGGLINNEQSTVRKRAFTQKIENRYFKSFNIVDPQQKMPMVYEDNEKFQYEFHPVEQQQNDLLTVGNTW